MCRGQSIASENKCYNVIFVEMQQLLMILYFIFQEAEDNDYKSEDSDSESTDSDISIDENDDVRSDADDDDEPKRKRRVVTKAYKVWLWGLNLVLLKCEALSRTMCDCLCKFTVKCKLYYMHL